MHRERRAERGLLLLKQVTLQFCPYSWVTMEILL